MPTWSLRPLLCWLLSCVAHALGVPHPEAAALGHAGNPHDGHQKRAQLTRAAQPPDDTRTGDESTRRSVRVEQPRRDSELMVVLSRCGEYPFNPTWKSHAFELHQAHIAHRVYQKGGSCVATRNKTSLAMVEQKLGRKRARELAVMSKRKMEMLVQLEETPGRVVRMELNKGRECSSYLQYMYDEYEQLPPIIFFMQFDSSNHLVLKTAVASVRAAADAVRRLGYVGLSRHTFKGDLPVVCEQGGRRTGMAQCSLGIYRDLKLEPPRTVRFYANGIFGVTRERIRARPRSFYAELLTRFNGPEPLRCAAAELDDCYVLEKVWHLIFGADAVLPPHSEYDELRAPGFRNITAGRSQALHEVKTNQPPYYSCELVHHHQHVRSNASGT